MKRGAVAHRRVEALVVSRLWALQLAFQARRDRALAELGLTASGFRLVGELMRAPEGLKQRELAQRLGIKASSVSIAVSRLEAAGVVERVEAREDSRAWRVRIAANAPLGPGIEVLEQLERELMGPLSERDRRRLVGLLERLTHQLAGGSP